MIASFSVGAFFFGTRPDLLLHVYFLDVGQGDAILIRTPQGKNILVDGGPRSNVMSELTEVLPFFDRSLDYVVLTHPDRDHIEGLLSVLRRHKVSKVLITGAHKSDFLSRGFFKIISEKKIPFDIVDAHDDFFAESGVFIDVLYPFAASFKAEKVTNNLSLMIKVIYGKNEILLTGDAEESEESALVSSRTDLHADVLKVAHHGSKTSSTEKFLKRVAPAYAVISVAAENSYGHPNEGVLQRLAAYKITTLRTDKNGLIEFIFSPEKLLTINVEKNLGSLK